MYPKPRCSSQYNTVANTRQEKSYFNIKNFLCKGFFSLKSRNTSYFSTPSYRFHIKERFLTEVIGRRLYGVTKMRLMKIFDIMPKWDYFCIAGIQKVCQVSYDIARRLLQILEEAHLVEAVFKTFRPGAISRKYRFTQKFSAQIGMIKKTIKGQIKMDSRIQKDKNLSYPAKVLFSAIDNFTNQYNIYYHNPEQLNSHMQPNQPISNRYQKELLFELQQCGYLQRISKRTYKLIHRSPRLKSSSELFAAKLQTGLPGGKPRNNNYNYKCNFDNQSWELDIIYNKKTVFNMKLDPELIYSQKDFARLGYKLETLSLNEFTKLFCYVYGPEYVYPQRSDLTQNEKLRVFRKIRGLLSQAFYDDADKNEIILAALNTRQNLAEKRGYAISWLKQGNFFHIKKLRKPQDEKDKINYYYLDPWRKQHGYCQITPEEKPADKYIVKEAFDDCYKDYMRGLISYDEYLKEKHNSVKVYSKASNNSANEIESYNDHVCYHQTFTQLDKDLARGLISKKEYFKRKQDGSANNNPAFVTNTKFDNTSFNGNESFETDEENSHAEMAYEILKRNNI